MYKEKEIEKGLYNRTRNSTDEVDIRIILRSFNSVFRAINHGLKYTFSLILRRKLFLLFFIVIGLLLGFGAFYVTKPYYKSSMTLVLADFRNQFVEDQLDRLTDMVDDDNYAAVSQQLNISVDEAQQIKEINFFNLDQDRIAKDSILTGSPFRVEVLLYKKELFDLMEESITSYLENNRYFLKQKKIRESQMKSLVSKLRDDISSIDSIKTASAAPRGPANGFVYGEALDPTNLYRESVSMYQQQVQLESELEQIDILQVVIGFTPQSRPVWPILPVFLAVGAFVAFILGLLIAFNLESKRETI